MLPTRRGWGLAGLALVCYLFANQTQVGWLYVFAALAAALLLATVGLPGRMLRGLRLTRQVNGAALAVEPNPAVNDTLTVTLTVSNGNWLPAVQVTGVEMCAPAPPADRTQPLFIPFLPGGHAAPLSYTVTCARRGWFAFGAVPLATRAPYGFWAARRVAPVDGPEGVLVFPETRPLARLDLFDRMPAVETSLARAGQETRRATCIGAARPAPGDWWLRSSPRSSSPR